MVWTTLKKFVTYGRFTGYRFKAGRRPERMSKETIMDEKWYNEDSSDEKRDGGNRNRPPSQRPPQRKGPKQYREDEFNWNKVGRVIASWLGILLAVFLIMYAFKSNEETEYEVTFTTYQQLLAENKVTEAIIKKANLNDFDFHGKLREPMDITTASGKTARGATRVVLTLPYIDQNTISEWNQRSLKFNIVKEDSTWISALVSFLPWILLIGIWLVIFRRMQVGAGGTKGLFSFGKSRAKLLTEGGNRVTFMDVAGADEAKAELQEIIEFLKDPGKFQRLGGKIPRGVLLLGPPGT